jgi:hypothetical protein
MDGHDFPNFCASSKTHTKRVIVTHFRWRELPI